MAICAARLCRLGIWHSSRTGVLRVSDIHSLSRAGGSTRRLVRPWPPGHGTRSEQVLRAKRGKFFDLCF